MKKSIAIMATLTATTILAPAGANAQLLSANVGGLGASVGATGRTNAYSAPTYTRYYYPNNYQYRNNSPIQQTVRYRNNYQQSTYTYPSSSYTRSYDYYPAYYNTGYSYPANSYSNYTYSQPSYGTGASVGIGL